MLGVIMFLSKLIMEGLPNIHLVGVLIMAYTLVYRSKALIPIYVFVMLTGLYGGFAEWWIAYLYAWTVLWGITMLLPRKMPRRVKCFIYPAVCSFHGLVFGILCAPAEAIMFKLSFEQMLVWLAAGAVFDITHAIGNLVAGVLVLPMSELLLKLEEKSKR